MRRMRRGWLGVVVGSLLACGCGHRDWFLTVPRTTTSFPTDSFYAFRVRAAAGGRTPATVTHVQARCVDPAICDAEVIADEVHVVPKHTGSTRVAVDAENPIYGDTEHHVFDVVVTDPPARAAIELGQPAPAGRELVHRVQGADVARCSTDSAGFAGDVAGSDRSDVHVYACSTFAEGRYRACDGALCSDDDSYLLCVHEAGGAITGSAVLELEQGRLVVASVEGMLATGVCAAGD